MSPTFERRVRIVLVGSGRMGQLRAALMYGNPRFEMCAVVDTNIAGAEVMAAKFSSLPFKTLLEAIAHFGVIKDSPLGLDGVVVATPTFAHEQVIREAAHHGLAIFTEKPVDETAEKIRVLFDLCKEKGAHLCCGFQRRFDDSYVSTAMAVKSGKIGKPVTASIFFADHPCPPVEFMLTGGNVFMDLTAHDIDYIRWVLEDDVESVYACGTSSIKVLEDAGVHDNATVILKFNKGTVVTITLSRSACYGYDQRCEIFGDKGLVTVANEHANTSTLSDLNGVHQARLKHSFPQRFNQAFGAELDAFADAILLQTPWPITANDCIAVQKVADAAKVSCDTNRVVKL